MNRRLLKLNRGLQKVLMEYFIRKMKHSLPGFISVKESVVASDMKSAKIFLSVMSEKDTSVEVLSILEKERYLLQKSVSDSLRMKFCPRLNFFINHVPYLLNSNKNQDSRKVTDKLLS